ncbi:MAG: hypothetical protein JNJ46_32545 [Myxococcales bacterium]|nr:hypothetical protein [Myxococcales bacterium]
MAELKSNGYINIASSAGLIRTGGLEAGKLVDFAWSYSPCLLGGLMTKAIYNWGVKYFKSDKGSWTITKTDEGAGAAAVLLFSFMVWRLAGESTMASMFVAGMVGRGSIVVRNTLYRIMGWQVPANMPDPDVIDVTPISANESNAGLDEEMLREIGRYGLKNSEFRDAVADGLGRRMNDWLTSQGRPPIDADAIHTGVKDIFESMSNRG